MKETICALATPAGGALALIRISGPQALEILSHIFHKPSSAGSPSRSVCCGLAAAPANTVHYGHIKDGSEIIDEVLVTIFRAPHSYTGEDSAEISTHGSPYIINKVLELLINAGCRQALPGEFTQRAYLNGKLDLSQAEAVADLIASTNAATHKMALSQLRGHFSSELSDLRAQLLHLTSLLELELDFSDHEDLEFADRSELLSLAKNIDKKITALAHSFQTGNALKRGIPVAIIGKTNVGKSTLLNRLLHDDKAIVSDIHGTTRDVIEDTTQIQGITFRFIDTAGLRTTTDRIEQLGIERTYQKLHEAAIVLWVIDQAPSPSELKAIQEQTADKPLIIIHNKSDLHKDFSSSPVPSVAALSQPSLAVPSVAALPQPSSLISLSAKYDPDLEALEAALVKAANIPAITENDVIVTSARHYESLLHAHEALTRVIEGMGEIPSDLLAEDLRLCITHLSDITGGTITTEETLQNIFSHFCVGK